MTIAEIALGNNTWFEMYFCISVFCLSHAASNWNSLNHEISYEEKNGSTKYPRNTHKLDLLIGSTK